jgi:outer membrane biosynthesis protein TonB
MSMRDGELEMVSIFGTAVITAALFVPVLYFTEKADAQKADFSDMESIEASIAYKKTPQKQPQKKVEAKQPVEKPEGVSHDETKPVEPKKDEPKKPPKKEDTDPLAKFKHPTDDDTQTGKPTTEPGDFNGNEFGWAPQTNGHPFWQKFAQDIHENFTLPTISAVNGIPVGCFHITPDGKIADTKFKEHSGSPDLDRAAQDAIDSVAKLRNANPTPVPTELLGAITRWICIRFDPKQAG